MKIMFILLNLCMAAAPGKVFFKNLKDGQIVPSKFKVEMGLEGKNLKPVGQEVENKQAGHHHIIINGGAIREGDFIPANDTHIHFGKAQAETELDLKKPGTYTLTLQLADGMHRSYGEKLSQTIKVTVK